MPSLDCENFRLNIEQIDSATVCTFATKKMLSEEGMKDLSTFLVNKAEDKNTKALVLDFSNVEHLSSIALSMLLNLDKKMKAKEGSLQLVGVSPQIFEVFKMTRLNERFSFHASVDKALAAIGIVKQSGGSTATYPVTGVTMPPAMPPRRSGT